VEKFIPNHWFCLYERYHQSSHQAKPDTDFLLIDCPVFDISCRQSAGFNGALFSLIQLSSLTVYATIDRVNGCNTEIICSLLSLTRAANDKFNADRTVTIILECDIGIEYSGSSNVAKLNEERIERDRRRRQVLTLLNDINPAFTDDNFTIFRPPDIECRELSSYFVDDFLVFIRILAHRRFCRSTDDLLSSFKDA
jgi:hypothetical protein